jgi:hypothetical protein
MSDCLAIIVPVMKRPQNAHPFMASLRMSMSEPRTVYAICDSGDDPTLGAWAGEGAVTLLCPNGSTFPIKAQYGYEQTRSEWIMLVGDDVRFARGWWTEVMKVACFNPEAQLIATNDMHNPFVTAGVHATHPVIKRSWVDESGASWDGPGHIVHTGYNHAYCDDEWSMKAKMEGVFAPALEARVDHLHPTWQQGPWDDVYALGIDQYGQDGQLYEERRRCAERRLFREQGRGTTR